MSGVRSSPRRVWLDASFRHRWPGKRHLVAEQCDVRVRRARQRNTVLRLGMSIAASNKITQSELDYNKINMFKGTYAARVYFTDVQDTGSSAPTG